MQIVQRILLVLMICLGLDLSAVDEKPVEKPVIVFDFGGVMADVDVARILECCADSLNVPLKEFNRVVKQEFAPLVVGKVVEEELWATIADVLEVPLPKDWKSTFHNVMRDVVSPRQEMYALVRDLREQGYSVALLSDITEWQADVLRDMGLYEDFSPVLLSCDLGLRKPSVEVYEHLLEVLGVEARDCIFIDDRIPNIEVAKDLGIHGILFSQFDEVAAGIYNCLETRIATKSSGQAFLK